MVTSLLKDRKTETTTEFKVQTSLHLAAESGKLEIVQRLLQDGKYSIYDENNNGVTPIHIAAEKGHKEVVELILQKDSKMVNARDSSGMTPLHRAAGRGQIGVVSLLLSFAGIDVNVRDSIDLIPLHCAAFFGQTEVVELILQKDESCIDQKTGDGCTVYNYSLFQSRLGVVRVLKDHQYDKIEKTPELKTGLEMILKAMGNLERKDMIALNELISKVKEINTNMGISKEKSLEFVVLKEEILRQIFVRFLNPINLQSQQANALLVQANNSDLVAEVLLDQIEKTPLLLSGEKARTGLSGLRRRCGEPLLERNPQACECRFAASKTGPVKEHYE